MSALKAPFPWFGGKSRVAHLVWDAFGPDVANYVEPFAGSLAVLLGRPGEPRVETVNDLDCYLANFWRALQADPEGVARHADWPVNEVDLHARHRWLVRQDVFRERMREDPSHYNVVVAGWWVWGVCAWIGSGWCAQPGWEEQSVAGVKGLSERTAGHAKRPSLGRGARGVHRLAQQKPDLSGDGGAAGRGVHASGRRLTLAEWMQSLAGRLRRVRVCCGDWARVVTPSPTVSIGTTAVFLDPPYAGETGRASNLYAQENLQVAHAVREWALANGDNPRLRIALCGYEGEHAMPASWRCVAWKASGGYAAAAGNTANAARERVWLSPHCLGVRQALLDFGRTA